MLAGRVSELESDLPYWAFVDALDEHLRSLAGDQLERADRWLGAELARIFPALAGRGLESRAVLDKRYRAHRAVHELLERLATSRPLTLVLDDVHWADPASIELLAGSCAGPRRRRSSWGWPCGRTRRRSGWPPPWSRRPGPDRWSAWGSTP